ncbi:GTP cyclohydrolase II [Kitasatospora sp. MAA4]|uniref:GTP cyclohydrolase II n=1 Tax=Kitasatospora sp. MAA4 TaxID=3035093 RepID=UPI002472F6E7|nr:GTP cyclohydrolase II [Kitasatospora sp. MAA4]MDH6132040.1 GTP cyclohydrolase II [Kitasatospora sp. MAA4]
MPSTSRDLPAVPPARVRTTVRVPLRFGDGYRVDADVLTFHDLADGAEHLALALGNPGGAATPLVRLHSECLTGDVFGSERCDCGPQLREAVEQIALTGGYLLYLRQEGRGIGLYNKLDAYALQDGGADTYAANAALGLPEDGRDYTAAAQMLHTLGADRIDLLSNNTDKAEQLAAYGIEVITRVPTGVHVSPSNVHYLRTKAHGTALTHAHTIQLEVS